MDHPRQPDPYNLVRYQNLPLSQTHPWRVSALGRLAGMDPPAVETCRVLELGASEGTNVIAMAHQFPLAQFTGLDLAEQPVASGLRFIEEFQAHGGASNLSALRNVRLTRMDLLDVDRSFGQFDYIIAHGLYSWTPPEVRDRILRIMGECLSAVGIGFVSYNTHPAGQVRRMVREMMLYRARHAQTVDERLEHSREVLRLLARKRTPKEIERMDAYDAMLAAHAMELLERNDDSLFHDDLSLFYEPAYFSDFAAHAASHGLQYLNDAGAPDPDGPDPANNLPKGTFEAVEVLSGGDRIAQLQYFDFVRMRRFRQSLVCRNEIALTPALHASRFVGLYAATRTKELGDGVFQTPGGSRIQSAHPALVGYMRRVIEAWPSSEVVSPNDADVALQLFRAHAIELFTTPGMAAKPGTKPRIDSLALFQVLRGDNCVTSLWHEPVQLDNGDRQFFRLLDGTRDREALARDMKAGVDTIEGNLEEAGNRGVLAE